MAMNDIIEINDLACLSIEQGDFYTALDVLNRCLACVKRLNNNNNNDDNNINKNDNSTCGVVNDKNGEIIITDDNIIQSNSSCPFEQHQSISDVLKAAKQKLILSAAANSHRRKLLSNETNINRPHAAIGTTGTNNNSTTTTNNVSMAAAVDDANSMVLRPRKRQKLFCGYRHQQQTVDAFAVVSSPHQNINNVTTEYGQFTENLLEVIDGEVDDDERKYYLYRTPLRLSQAQLSRIDECRRSCLTNDETSAEQKNDNEEQRKVIEREIELAVSSNLIFNIALSHHLIAMENDDQTATATTAALSSNGSTGNSIEQCNNNIFNGNKSSSTSKKAAKTDDNIATATITNTNNRRMNGVAARQSRREQRLKGALRLYELGFRVHAKRAAAIGGRNIAGGRRERRQQRREVRQREDEELRSATRYALALINNCSQIHERLGHADRANAFRNRLLSFLLMMVDGGESVTDIITDESTLDGYWKNAFSFGNVFNHETAPASAA